MRAEVLRHMLDMYNTYACMRDRVYTCNMYFYGQVCPPLCPTLELIFYASKKNWFLTVLYTHTKAHKPRVHGSTLVQ